MSTIINIAIVEDDPDILRSMQEFIDRDDRLFCRAVFTTGNAILNAFKTLDVHVVLMDITLPDVSGIVCVGKLKPKRPEVQFLMCTANSDTDRIFDSLCAGATGYMLKSSPPDRIIESIIDVFNGGSPMSPQIARMVVGSFTVKNQNARLLDTLTPREQEILQALSKGYPYKNIADQLGITVETVRTYVRKIYEKLQVHSRTEALNKVFPKN